jgi:N-methylhydantoinase A
MHACALAEELGCKRILVPAACGVLSALGLALGDLRRDYIASAFLDADSPDVDRLFAELAERARGDLPGAAITRYADCRYAGQSFELTVRADDRLRERFETEHASRYGHRAPERVVEVVALRLVATVAGVTPVLSAPAADPSAFRSRRDACFDGVWRSVEVVPRAALGPGDRLTGPTIVEFDEATCVIRPGWDAVIDDVGTMILEKTQWIP